MIRYTFISKKIFVLVCILLFSFVFVSCSREKTKIIEEKPPKRKEYIVTDRKEILEIVGDDSGENYSDIEQLERFLGIYAAADMKENILSIADYYDVKEFKLVDNYIVDKSNQKIAKYKYKNNRFLVETKLFMQYFNSTILSEEEYKEYLENDGKVKDRPIPVVEEPKYKKYNYVLAWDLYANKSDRKYDETIDVVIPKWLSLQDSTGRFNDLFRADYYENAKKQGKEVWVLVSNSFDPDMTSKALNSYFARQKMIEYLINYSALYNVGINIDFENMYLSDSDVFVQFIAELGVRMRTVNQKLSVCVTVPGGSDNWSKVYDRPRLAENVDFLTLMAYDQHWASSQVSGPVAAYDWVLEHVDNMVQGKLTMRNGKVPAEKIILGLPFYTRIWYESYSDEKPNTIKVRSRSVYMDTPRNMLEEQGSDYIKVWDESSKTNFHVYYDEKGKETIKFWYDDEEAIYQKAKIAEIRGLSGLACWALGFENPNIWKHIAKVKEQL